MNYPADFLAQIKKRAGDRCECERSECHRGPGRCSARLPEEPGGPAPWAPVHTGEHLRFPPVPADYIALCEACAVPRNATRKA